MDEGGASQKSHLCSCYFDCYYHRSLALLPLQLVCHMRSHDKHVNASESSMLEVFAKAICAFTESLAEVTLCGVPAYLKNKIV